MGFKWLQQISLLMVLITVKWGVYIMYISMVHVDPGISKGITPKILYEDGIGITLNSRGGDEILRV